MAKAISLRTDVVQTTSAVVFGKVLNLPELLGTCDTGLHLIRRFLPGERMAWVEVDGRLHPVQCGEPTEGLEVKLEDSPPLTLASVVDILPARLP